MCMWHSAILRMDVVGHRVRVISTSRLLNLTLYGQYAFFAKQIYSPDNTAPEVCGLFSSSSMPCQVWLSIKKKWNKADVSCGRGAASPERKMSVRRKAALPLHGSDARLLRTQKEQRDLCLTPWFQYRCQPKRTSLYHGNAILDASRSQALKEDLKWAR